jgi:hypothetical protein
VRTLPVRVTLVLSLILASPLAALAGNGESEDTLWEWIVRWLIQAAGGWFGY